MGESRLTTVQVRPGRARWVAIALAGLGAVLSAAGCGNDLAKSIPTAASGATTSTISVASRILALTDAVVYGVPPLTAVAPAPAVRVLDQFGAPMSGIQVAFNTGAAGTIVTLATTDSTGRAECGPWIMGSEEAINSLTAGVINTHISLTFRAMAVRPSAAGVTDVGYALQSRDGQPPPSYQLGYLVLSSDGTFRLTYGYSALVFTVGTYTQSGSSLELLGRSGELQGDRLTLSYPDFDDLGTPVTVVEIFTRYR